ncbi:MAG: TIGR02710 family CRISPR-associated protein [Acetobacteraceae bacterium]|nr:TIGR02710 family CRISPR-associated protein [Acetobacteraceae bacterium]
MSEDSPLPGKAPPEARPVLLITVGGSPDPLVSAIRALNPRFVCFAVTESEGGKTGSITMLQGKEGLVQRAGLKPGCWEHVAVPHDDPDRAFAILRKSLQALQARYNDAELVADYTGGTKSMSAALLYAVVAVPGVRAQFMAGERPDLVQVRRGTERPQKIDLTWLLAEREAARFSAGWARFAYAEAEEGIAAVLHGLAEDNAAPRGTRGELITLQEFSAFFAAWDRFDHETAFRRLNAMPEELRNRLAPWRPSLALLCDSDAKRKGGMQCLDLWRNAERRAARGLYDDAVARCYRMLEATAQWHLLARHDMDTADMPWEKIPPEILEKAGIERRENQKGLGGLMPSFRLWEALEPEGLMAKFLKQVTPPDYPKKPRPGERELRNMLDLRNHSILAHGFRPIRHEEWERFGKFCRELFLPQVLRPALQAAGLPTELPQLPQAPP